MESDQLLILRIASELEKTGRFGELRNFRQHGNTSVYEHSINVAAMSLQIAKKLHLKVDRETLVRGALLHDYFLYDWHKDEPGRPLHGFYHPKAALENASNDYPLTKEEKEIIRKHMFPLTPVPPRNTSAWIVSLADKICTVRETKDRPASTHLF